MHVYLWSKLCCRLLFGFVSVLEWEIKDWLQLVNKQTNQPTNQPTNKRTIERTNEQTNERTNRQIDRQTNKQDSEDLPAELYCSWLQLKLEDRLIRLVWKTIILKKILAKKLTFEKMHFLKCCWKRIFCSILIIFSKFEIKYLKW